MDQSQKNSFGDLLRVEGIQSMGFGILPKFIMIDTDLTLEAKSIYAYFCSYAGNGTTTFPSRSKILFDLSIAKNRYYKHFDLLLQQGYITVKQQKEKNSTRFARNIYTLVSNPKKFQNIPQNPSKKQLYNNIAYSGLKSLGYGMIPKSVMIDQRLSIKSKGIYAYFCTFTGAGNIAFPQKDKILYHLGINEKTYYKFFNVLKEYNYITVVQRHIDGKLSTNEYILNDTPNEVNTSNIHFISTYNQYSKNDDTEHNQYSKNDDTINEDTINEDTINEDTNINNLNINNLKNNSSHSLSLFEQIERMSEQNPEDLYMIIKDELLTNKKIPYIYHTNRQCMTAAIHYLTNWTVFYPNGCANELDQSIYNLFNEALIDMCCTKELIKVKGAIITYANVIDKINEIAKFNENSIDIYEYVNVILQNFKKAIKEHEIKNPLAYMKSCIWDVMQTSNVSLYGLIERDLHRYY